MNILIIVDVQNDFCPGGSLATEKGAEIIPNINRLTASIKFDTIIATQDWHPENHVSFASKFGIDPFVGKGKEKQGFWPDHCVIGTKGAELHPNLDQNKIEMIVRKGFSTFSDSYSALYDNNETIATALVPFLRTMMRPDTNVYVCGIATDYCVLYTVLDLLYTFSNGSVFVIKDACASVADEASALLSMSDHGAKITTVNEVLE